MAENWRREWETLKRFAESFENPHVFSYQSPIQAFSVWRRVAGVCVGLAAFADFASAMELEMTLDPIAAQKNQL
jgi:hypothetical protein